MKCRRTLGFLCAALTAAVDGASGQEALLRSIESNFPSSYNELAQVFDSNAVPDAIELLNSEEQEKQWTKVAAVLGVVGDDRAVDALIEFIERPVVIPIYISMAHHNTRREAIKSLGVAVNRTGNERALNYLIESLDDSAWRRRGIQGVDAAWPTYDQYDRRLSIYAIFGLALSGHPRAGEALRTLQRSPRPNQTRLRSGLDDVLTTWLDIYERVAEVGVIGLEGHSEFRMN